MSRPADKLRHMGSTLDLRIRLLEMTLVDMIDLLENALARLPDEHQAVKGGYARFITRARRVHSGEIS